MKPAEPKLPQIVMPIWSDTVLHQAGKPAVRGFGGRVYFYEREGGDPIKVDGSISVYVFDGDDKRIANAKPLRKFVIKPDQLAGHHSTSDIGDSYSVWIPWDKVGGQSRSLSLITRFDGRNGGTAISNPTSKLLPGVASEQEIDSPSDVDSENSVVADGSGIQQVGFTGNASSTSLNRPNGDADPSSLNSYSLPLPPSFQRRLKNSPVITAPNQKSVPGLSNAAVTSRTTTSVITTPVTTT